MTSAKSSANPFRFTFFRTMQKNWHFPALIMAIITLITVILGLGERWITWKDHFSGTEQPFSDWVRDYNYILGESVMRDALYMGFMMLLAMATGVMIFRYMFSKKAVNVYYSLGITRSNMFLAKYLSGAFMLVLAVLLPLSVDILLNIIVFGSMKELWITALFYFLGTSLSLLFAYSVAVAVSCRVGTVIEAIIYSGVFLLAPIFLTYIVEFFYMHFLYGSPIYNNEWINRYYSTPFYGRGYGYGTELDFYYSAVPISDVSDFSYVLHKTRADWIMPDFKGLIPLAVLVILVAVISLLTYKKRKVEKAGFLGVDELTKALSVFLISSVITTFIIKELISYTPDISFFTALLTALVFFVVYIFFDIVTIHNFRKIVKSFWKYPVYLLVVSVIVFMFTSGFFGYSSRVPDVEDVESVSVSTGTGDVMMNYSELSASKESSGPNDLADYYLLAGIFNQGVVDDITEADVIENVIEIHKKFIECKNLNVNHKTLNAGYGKRVLPVNIRIIYELKDGKIFERKYPVATDEIMQMLAEITKTDRYKYLATQYIKKPAAEMMYNDEFGEHYYEVTPLYDDWGTATKEEVVGYAFSSEVPFTFRGADVLIASPLFSNVTYIPSLTTDFALKDNLLEAICADIENDSLPLNYRTDSEILGYLVFDLLTRDYEEYNSTMIRYQGGTVVTENMTEPTKINVFGGEFKTCIDGRVTVPVYADMTNTVNFLKVNGLEGYLSETAEVSKIRVWAPDEQSVADEYTYRGASMLWCGCWYNTDETFLLIPANATSITDKKDIEKVSSYCTMMCLECYENNYAEIIFEDGSRTFAAIPIK